VVPRVAPDGEAGFGRISGGTALRAFAPSTMAQLGAFDDTALGAMSALCRQLPCYELRLGSDIPRVAEQVREIIGAAVAEQSAPVGSSA
jgi:hypothetical protein